MKGTLQIVVNLRSRSVEFSGETDPVNRNSTVLRSDAYIASDFHDMIGYPDETLDEKVIRGVKSIHEMGRTVGNLDYLMIERGGNKCYIHPDDISFVTIDATDDLAEIEE